MTLEVVSVGLWRMELQTRLPFKYGIATMERLPHLFVEVCLSCEGKNVSGFSADHLPPKWFTKDSAGSLVEEVAQMEHVIQVAADRATGIAGRTVFELWLQLYRWMEVWRQSEGIPPLLAHFGTSLVERAVIDAFCRARRSTLAAEVRNSGLGLRLGEIHPELAGYVPSALLPTNPARSTVLRHTVGLSDPINGWDTVPDLADGLPYTLEENISRYGLLHFKIKFTGEADLPRLVRIFDTIAQASGKRRFTLDGNESFVTVEAFRCFWTQIEALPMWEALKPGLLCVEQPFHRSVALSDEIGRALLGWAQRPPLIIDESDAEWDSLRRGLGAGYVGTSHKNCKGVFRGIANACLLAHRRRMNPDNGYLQTGEDLANVGPIALLQDLAVQALLGIESVERNGHHYFRGLSFLPDAEQTRMVAAHPDLYSRRPEGFVALAISHGVIDLGSVVEAPFGVGFVPTLEEYARPLIRVR